MIVIMSQCLRQGKLIVIRMAVRQAGAGVAQAWEEIWDQKRGNTTWKNFELKGTLHECEWSCIIAIAIVIVATRRTNERTNDPFEE